MESLRSISTSSKGITRIQGEVILLLRHDKTREKVVTLLEGPKDAKFYKLHFDGNATYLHQCNNCKCVSTVLAYIQANIKTDRTIIGIEDLDFKNPNCTQTHCKHLFYTDRHDHEMMALAFPELMHKVWEQIFKEEPDTTVINQTFEDLLIISTMKWMNYIQHLNCRFKGIKFYEWTKEQLHDFAFIKGQLESNSTKMHEFTESDFSEFKESHRTFDFYDIITGHDFINRLIYLKKSECTRFTNINEEKFHDAMTRSFDYKMFKSTKLYTFIRNWELTNGKSILNQQAS